MSGFPVFSNDGQQVGDLVDAGQQGSSASFAGPGEMKLPVAHNGQEQESADANFRAVMLATNPTLLRAFDLRERRQREHAEWQALVSEKVALVYAKTVAWQRVSPDQPALALERREALALAQDELREAREELLASREGLDAAEQRVANLTGAA